MEKADLAATECAAFPGVPAEDLFLIESIDSDRNSEWFRFYLRRKVYVPKSAQEEGILSIEYDDLHTVDELAARVIKRNGQIIELGEKDFTDAVLQKHKGTDLRSKTLVFSNLEAGDIVEYQWLQDNSSRSFGSNYIWIQSEYPRRLFEFTLKSTFHACEVLWFNTEKFTATKEDGYQVLRVTDVPPYRPEPYMPPVHNVRGYIALINTSWFMSGYENEELWRKIATGSGEQKRLECKPDYVIKHAANAAISGVTKDREKIERLYNLARREITNLNYYTSDELVEPKKKIDHIKGAPTAAQVADLRVGYSKDVNQYFASLCTAAGFQVYWVKSSSKRLTTLVQHPQGYLLMHSYIVGVKSEDGLLFYSPGDLFIPPGMIDSSFEQAPGLLLDEYCQKEQFVFPQAAAPKDSVEKRVGTFTLSAEGDLEGTVTITYTGHLAAERKRKWYLMTKQEIEMSLRSDLTEVQPAAEFSDFEFLNTDTLTEPTTVKYKMKVSGYAETVGDRLAVSPSVFQKGASLFFKASTRKFDIAFAHSWEVLDDVSLTYPADMEIDTPTAPQSLGKEEESIRVRYTLTHKKKSHSLHYERDLVIGDHEILTFPAQMYPALKHRFELLLKSDEHTILLKPRARNASAVATPGATPPRETN